jgi:hypothetical protein
MNDYTMVQLAADRGRALRAEAERQRLANNARQHRPAGPAAPARVRERSPLQLLRRVMA